MKTSVKDLLNLLITFISYQTFIIRNNFTIFISTQLKYCKKMLKQNKHERFQLVLDHYFNSNILVRKIQKNVQNFWKSVFVHQDQ